jgi:hypothetical protein
MLCPGPLYERGEAMHAPTAPLSALGCPVLRFRSTTN